MNGRNESDGDARTAAAAAAAVPLTEEADDQHVCPVLRTVARVVGTAKNLGIYRLIRRFHTLSLLSARQHVTI